ncbi:MAG: hypothetical protein AAFQ14_17095 [Cyanobacteria bacterium J06621_12]
MDETSFAFLNSSHEAKQILCLEYQGNCLYGEVIQLIPQRQLCWLRPLCLVISHSVDFELLTDSNDRRSLVSSSSCDNSDDSLVIDLQSGSDLLWPAILFRPALDTEIISLMPLLKDIGHHSLARKSGQKWLHRFMHLVWQGHRDKF